jgi:two-component system probable response regulator PhcQ
MKRLLLVDDESNVLSALKRVFRARFGSQVCVEAFTDPDLALVRVKEVSFDVIMSDYRMPQMTGIEFLLQAREIQPLAVRMILSATSDFEIIQRAINEIEVYRFLAKPWTDLGMAEQIADAIDRAGEQRQERQLADAMRSQQGTLSDSERERHRLEALEPGITHVDWGPNGEVLMPEALIDIFRLPPESNR